MNKIENIDVYFEIRENDNYIRLEPIEYLYSNSIHDWDKNCVQTKVSVKGGQFSGVYIIDLMTFDFERFKQHLYILYNNLKGCVNFKDSEYFLIMEINGDGLGNFVTKVITNDKGVEESSSELTFSLKFDQTQISTFISQLDNITKKYPIIGDFKIKNKSI